MFQEEKLSSVWQTVLGELEVDLGKNNFGLYFKGSQFLALDNNVARLGFRNQAVVSLVNSRYYGLIQNSLQKHLHTDKLSLVFSDLPHQTVEDVGPLFEVPKEDKQAITDAVKRSGLRPDFVLEDFCVSTSNQLAFAAAQAVITNPGKNYNPLFLWGGTGIGKTHLMQAVGHELIRQNPNARIVYLTAEQFTNEIVEGIRTKNTRDFKDKYRSAKAFLVDDVQFIAGKDRAQEEFFHTFNAITQNGGQVVLTSDKKPTDIKFIEDRLRSRFEGGMVADISEPDHELKTAICILKARKRGIELSTTVASAIADNVDNIRSLEGALQKLINESSVKNISINESLVIPIETKHDGRQILDSVCQYYNLPIKLLKSEKRDRSIAQPRQILMFLLKTYTRMTYMEIASFLDRADHTTIIHGVKKITTMLTTSPQIRTDVDEIVKKI